MVRLLKQVAVEKGAVLASCVLIISFSSFRRKVVIEECSMVFPFFLDLDCSTLKLDTFEDWRKLGAILNEMCRSKGIDFGIALLIIYLPERPIW